MVTSTRKSGRKKSARYKAGSGGIGGKVLAITMRSNGSSKIIGAAMAPTAALASLVHGRCVLLIRMTAKTAAAPMKVTGVMGFAGGALAICP